MGFDDNHVPKGWKATTLGQVATVVMGASPPSAVVNDHGDGLPFLQGNAEFGSQTPTPTNWCSDPGKRAQPGDILMSVRAPVGETNRADREYCIGRGLAAIRLQPDDRDFGWYALRHGMPQLQRVAQGSTFDAINRDELLKFALLLPTPRERKRIASILGSIDTALERTRAVIDQVRVVKQALLADLMTNGLPGRHKKFKTVKRIGRIPQRWSSARLDAIAQVVRGSSPRPAGDARFFNGDHVPWITVKSVTIDDGMYLTETETRLTKEGAERSRYLEKGTLVLTNSGATLGVPKILGISGCANDGIAAFLNLDESTNTVFLYHFLSTMTLRFREVIAPGLGQPNLNTDLIGATVVPIPSPKEQTVISEVVNSVDDRIESETLSLGQMLVVKQALSDALLTGRIRIITEEVIL